MLENGQVGGFNISKFRIKYCSSSIAAVMYSSFRGFPKNSLIISAVSVVPEKLVLNNLKP